MITKLNIIEETNPIIKERKQSNKGFDILGATSIIEEIRKSILPSRFEEFENKLHGGQTSLHY